MTSFTLTSSAAVTAPQTLSLGTDTGFIGSLAALVTSGETAVTVASSAGGAFLVNNGTIVSSALSILAQASFRLINTGLIAGEGNAISQSISSITVSSTVIQNSGSILANAGTAIQVLESGLRLMNDGLVGGYETAIYVGSVGAADVNEITNSGRIAVQIEAGFAINAQNALRLMNTGEILGNISGSTQNDYIDTRSGTITGQITLGDGDDAFRGSAGDDHAASGLGNDTLRGNGGEDTLTSEGGDDFIYGGTGDDVMSTGGGASRLYGGAGDDAMVCGGGRDEITGGAGDDLIIGGTGRDTLFGGTGADQFRFNGPPDSKPGQPDAIRDFQHGIDRIDLSQLPGILSFAGNGPLTGGGTASVAYGKSGNVLTVRVDADGDGTADMAITVLGASQLTAGDFVL